MPFRNLRVLLVCVAAAGWLTPTPSEAAVFECGSGDVGCVVAAINQANANGKTNTIRLAAGVYTLSSVDNDTDGPTGLPVVTGHLSIIGAGANVTGLERAEDAPQFRILDVSATGMLTVRGVTVRNGELTNVPSGPRNGPGILASGTVMVIDSVITENRSRIGFGGGVAGGMVTVRRSTISLNRSAGGGGIFIGLGGNLTVDESEIEHNRAEPMGGAGVWFASGGRLSIRDSVIAQNSANLSSYGGGIFVGGRFPPLPEGASVTIARSTISLNGSDPLGGGIYLSETGSDVRISQSAVVNNGAFQDGGGIMVGAGTVSIRETTIAGNYAHWGGGLLIQGGSVTIQGSTVASNLGSGAIATTVGTTTLENTILAFNEPPPTARCQPFTSLGHNVIGDPVPCVPLQSTDLTGDPGLGAYIDPGRPGTGHYPLLAGSPAIDTGDDDACGRTDQLGLPRPVRGRDCDIGAIEFYPIVNDLVWLEHMRSEYVPPDPDNVNPLALGGEYRVEAVFRNGGSESICQVAFEAATLTQDGSPTPALLTEHGELIGRQGIVWPATLAGGSDSLRVREHERYHFTIGVNIAAPMIFELNVLGKVGRCKADHHGEGREDHR